MGKSFWIFIGTLSLGLGVLGLFLPVLPTTPFLLLAAFSYGRGSERFYNWLLNRSWAGNYIRSYREGRGIPRKQKLLTIALLWVTIGITIGFAVTTWWLKIILAGVCIGVTAHLVRIKTWQPEVPAEANQVQYTDLSEIERF